MATFCKGGRISYFNTQIYWGLLNRGNWPFRALL